jgi:hypothetical protein
MKKLKFTAKVFKWSGESAWYFVAVDLKQSLKVKEFYKKSKRSLFSMKVEAKIGKTKWNTSLFPTKEGPLLMAIKKSVRYEEAIDEGDMVTINCTLL